MLARTVLRKVQTSNVVVARNISKTAVRAGGHGDDHGHHVHYMWEELPFKKSTIGGGLVGIVVVGVGAILWSCAHQNHRHGFSGKH